MDGLVTRSGAWYTVTDSEKKFQSKDFQDLLVGKEEGFESICKELGEKNE
jgi:hypothetical protein